MSDDLSSLVIAIIIVLVAAIAFLAGVSAASRPHEERSILAPSGKVAVYCVDRDGEPLLIEDCPDHPALELP